MTCTAAEQPEKDNPLRTAEMTLEDAKPECAEHKPPGARSPRMMYRGMTAYEPKQEVAAGMGILPRRERQAAV